MGHSRACTEGDLATTFGKARPSVLHTALPTERRLGWRMPRLATKEVQVPSWSIRAAAGLAATRVLLGLAALAVPEPAGRAWIGAGACGRDRAVLLRALGGRDVALGLGALLALGTGGDVGRWLVMGATSDLVDAAASAAAFAALPMWSRWLVLVASGGAACAGIVIAADLSTRS